MARRTRQELEAAIEHAIRASQSATEAFDELASQRLGINRTDMHALEVIQRLGCISAGQLAEETKLTTGAVTAVIDRLEEAGLARRVPDAEDRRRVLVELTEKANARVEAIWGPMKEAALADWSRYSVKELEVLLNFWIEGRAAQMRAREALEELADFRD